MHLEHAERLFVLGGDESDLGVLRAEQARQAVGLGNADSAVARARDAERLLRDDERHLGLKWHVLAAAYRLAGDLDQAETFYTRALDALKERRQWREASVVAREFGKVAVVGCRALHIAEDEKSCTIGNTTFEVGTQLTLNGETGDIYQGAVDVTIEKPDISLAKWESWKSASFGDDNHAHSPPH